VSPDLAEGIKAHTWRTCLEMTVLMGTTKYSAVTVSTDARRGNSGAWHVLTVDFDAPSHEFTFNVGIDLISDLIVLTPLI
jgi:hypothetical protein